MLELAEACTRVTGIDLEPVFEPARLGELERSVLDPTLAERELGFRAGDRRSRTDSRERGSEGEGGTGAN